LAVTLKRFFAPEWVFIFGIVVPFVAFFLGFRVAGYLTGGLTETGTDGLVAGDEAGLDGAAPVGRCG